MEVSSHLHDPTALRAPAAIEYAAGWTPEAVWTLPGAERYLGCQVAVPTELSRLALRAKYVHVAADAPYYHPPTWSTVLLRIQLRWPRNSLLFMEVEG